MRITSLHALFIHLSIHFLGSNDMIEALRYILANIVFISCGIGLWNPFCYVQDTWCILQSSSKAKGIFDRKGKIRLFQQTRRNFQYIFLNMVSPVVSV